MPNRVSAGSVSIHRCPTQSHSDRAGHVGWPHRRPPEKRRTAHGYQIDEAILPAAPVVRPRNASRASLDRPLSPFLLSSTVTSVHPRTSVAWTPGVFMLRLRAELVDAFRRLDTCKVSNAVETFDVRLRNEGFADSSVRAVFDDLPPILGRAVTARIHGSAPPQVGHTYYDRTDWWTYILTVPPPRIVVVEDADERPGIGRVRRRGAREHPESARLRGVRHQRLGAGSALGAGDGIPALRAACGGVPRLRAHRRLRPSSDGWRSHDRVGRHRVRRPPRSAESPGGHRRTDSGGRWNGWRRPSAR